MSEMVLSKKGCLSAMALFLEVLERKETRTEEMDAIAWGVVESFVPVTEVFASALGPSIPLL